MNLIQPSLATRWDNHDNVMWWSTYIKAAGAAGLKVQLNLMFNRLPDSCAEVTAPIDFTTISLCHREAFLISTASGECRHHESLGNIAAALCVSDCCQCSIRGQQQHYVLWYMFRILRMSHHVNCQCLYLAICWQTRGPLKVVASQPKRHPTYRDRTKCWLLCRGCS